jgi:hypothetical protein
VRVFCSVFGDDEEAQDDAVDVAKVWPRGIAIITCAFRIFVLTDLGSTASAFVVSGGGGHSGAHPVAYKPHVSQSGDK